MGFMVSRTRTLMEPRLTSFKGFELDSMNLRFLGLVIESFGGVGSRITGSAARISSGNRSGKGFPLFALSRNFGSDFSYGASAESYLSSPGSMGGEVSRFCLRFFADSACSFRQASRF